MTYIYEVIETGQQIEVEQSIKEPPHTVLEVDGNFHNVRRLVSGGTGFLLSQGGVGWSKQGYSKAGQKRW